MNKERLVSVTKKDFDIQYYPRSSGKGGQKVNKTSSAVRVRHRASGAEGKCSDSRKQHENKVTAFSRLVKSDKFQRWLSTENTRVLLGREEAEKRLKAASKPSNLKIDVIQKGSWITVKTEMKLEL